MCGRARLSVRRRPLRRNAEGDFVIQPAIPTADITPLERLLLSHIFHAQPDGDAFYFCAKARLT